MLVIGSHSLPWRKSPSDIDLIATPKEIHQLVDRAKELELIKHCAPMNEKKYLLVINNQGEDLIIEIEMNIGDNSSNQLENLVNQHNLISHNLDVLGFQIPVINMDVTYALKMSHRFLKNSPHFEKTHSDIMKLREVRGSDCIIPELLDWYDNRELETYEYKHPKLNQSKSAFFDTPGVTYKYDHDSLHEAVKHLEKPAYTYFIKDGEQVMCDREKFDKLPHMNRLMAVVEESMVLALERCLVPFNFSTAPKDAYKMALQKVCTSITSGWFRDFAWENYNEALEFYSHCDGEYVSKFLDGLQSGTVKLHGN